MEFASFVIAYQFDGLASGFSGLREITNQPVSFNNLVMSHYSTDNYDMKFDGKTSLYYQRTIYGDQHLANSFMEY